MLNNLKIKTKSLVSNLGIALSGAVSVLIAVISVIYLDNSYNDIVKIDSLIVTNERLVSENEFLLSTLNKSVIENKKLENNLNTKKAFQNWTQIFHQSPIVSNMSLSVDQNIKNIDKNSQELFSLIDKFNKEYIFYNQDTREVLLQFDVNLLLWERITLDKLLKEKTIRVKTDFEKSDFYKYYNKFTSSPSYSNFSDDVKKLWKEAFENVKMLYALGQKVKDLQKIDNQSALDFFNKELKKQHMKARMSLFDIRSRIAHFRVLNEPLINIISVQIPQKLSNIKSSLSQIRESLEVKKDSLEDSSSSLINKIFTVFVIIGIIGTISFILSFLINRDIVNCIKSFSDKLKEFLNFVSLKQHQIEKADVNSKDELGMMLVELNNSIDIFDDKITKDTLVVGEMVLIMDKVERGMYKCKVSSSCENPQITTLKDTMNTMMDSIRGNISKIEQVLKSYENQDLVNRVQKDSRITDEMASIIHRVNKLGDRLSTNAKTNLLNGLELSRQTTNINENINKLTEKSKIQTDSLEDTSNAIDGITINLRESHKKTSEMSSIANDLKVSAQNGNELTQQTSIAMDKINESMNAVIDAIVQIDQIAFQTNILSLNAAVEAATAGEAGKGFAVVASEVRTLASKSAETSSEIRKIVDLAKTSSTQGDAISKDMLAGFQELNEKILLTSELIDDVSARTDKQMQSMEVVNDKIKKVDDIAHESFDISLEIKDIAKSIDTMSIDLVDSAKKINFSEKKNILSE
jgi:methyl-accepting chemotaxis protein